jgi:hypothetical protein
MGCQWLPLRGKATVTLEARAAGKSFTLSTTAEARELFRDELLLQGTTPEVGKGFRFSRRPRSPTIWGRYSLRSPTSMDVRRRTSRRPKARLSE